MKSLSTVLCCIHIYIYTSIYEQAFPIPGRRRDGIAVSRGGVWLCISKIAAAAAAAAVRAVFAFLLLLFLDLSRPRAVAVGG